MLFKTPIVIFENIAINQQWSKICRIPNMHPLFFPSSPSYSPFFVLSKYWEKKLCFYLLSVQEFYFIPMARPQGEITKFIFSTSTKNDGIDVGFLVEQETSKRLRKNCIGEWMEAGWEPVRCILQSWLWNWHLSFTFMSLSVKMVFILNVALLSRSKSSSGTRHKWMHSRKWVAESFSEMTKCCHFTWC